MMEIRKCVQNDSHWISSNEKYLIKRVSDSDKRCFPKSPTLRIRVSFGPSLVTQKVCGCLKWVRSFASFQPCEISTFPVPQRPRDIRLWYPFTINVSKATEADKICRFSKKNMFLLKKKKTGQDLCIWGLWCLTSNMCFHYLRLCLTKTDRQTEGQMRAGLIKEALRLD